MRIVEDTEIIIATMTGDVFGNSMSTETPGDIASVNYFCAHTLWKNYCVIQHVKLPFVAYEEARHRKVSRLHVACIMQACLVR